MLVSLTPHPDTPSTAIDRIEVHIERREERLWLRFVAKGAVDAVAWPEPATSDRTDDLWKTTCFEAFIPTDDGYREFNLSPSGQWASYRFDGYRSGMTAADEMASIVVLDDAEDHRTLEALIDLPPNAFYIGLAVVIEELDGAISYWALAIPPGKPDFHHTDSFALALPTLELS